MLKRFCVTITFCFYSIFIIGQLDSLQLVSDRSEDLAIKAEMLVKMAEFHREQEHYDSAFFLLNKAIGIYDENTINIRQESVYNDINRSLSIIIGCLFALGMLLIFAFTFIRQKNKHNKELRSKNEIINNAMLEKDTLLREIHHRVKNNLQIVSSILSLQGRYSDDPKIESAIREGKDRVKSMSLIHQNLYQKDNLTGVDVQDYFTKLFGSLFSSYNIQPDKIKLALNIAPLNLDVDTIIPIGLVVNELVSNALKHAFPNDRSGTISVSLQEANDHIVLVVQDNGIGLDTNDLSASESMGYTLINTFKNKLNAEVEIDVESGTRITLQIKKYKKVA